MKKAYFIMGPESAGNRIMCKAIESTERFGRGGCKNVGYIFTPKWLCENIKHFNFDILDKSLKNAPSKITFVVSVPYGSWPGKKMYQISSMCNLMIEYKYKIYPIVMNRKFKYIIKSQVSRKHVPTEDVAMLNILMAYEHIFNQLALSRLQPIIVKYELLSSDNTYINYIFNNILELNIPNTDFYNANKKYNKGDNIGKSIRSYTIT